MFSSRKNQSLLGRLWLAPHLHKQVWRNSVSKKKHLVKIRKSQLFQAEVSTTEPTVFYILLAQPMQGGGLLTFQATRRPFWEIIWLLCVTPISHHECSSMLTQSRDCLPCEDAIDGQGRVYSLRERSLQSENIALLDTHAKTIYVFYILPTILYKYIGNIFSLW